MKPLIEHKRLKELREELLLTQAQFGERLGLKSGTADIERGKIKVSGRIVMILLKDFNINPLWLFGESDKKHLNPRRADILPKMISVDGEGHENILLVNEKAAAGYGLNIGDAEYYRQLPVFGLPLPQYRHATFRGFQIVGDSMRPLVESGDWVLAKAVPSYDEVKDRHIYVVVETESIRLKRIIKRDDGRSLELISLNPEYPPVSIKSEAVLELWEYHSKISFGIDKIQGLSLEKLYDEVREIRQQLKNKA